MGIGVFFLLVGVPQVKLFWPGRQRGKRRYPSTPFQVNIWEFYIRRFFFALYAQ